MKTRKAQPRRSLRRIVSLLRRRANKQWKEVATERINAENEGRSMDEQCAREEMQWLRGYFDALKEVQMQANI